MRTERAMLRERPMRHGRNPGFTLIEILIALAIFAVVIAQAFAVFGAQHLTYTGTERSIEVQQDVRLVTDALLSEVRMAGYMLPPQTGISSVDGGNTSADVLCVSDPSKMDDAKVAAANARFPGPAVTAAVIAGVGVVVVDEPDIDDDGEADFEVGEGIIVVDGTSSHCGVIRTISGANDEIIAFTPDTPAGFSASIGTGRAVPAIVYRVAGNDLFRNDLRLSNQVEDLQVEFGVDADDDGQIAPGEYVDVLNGSDPLDILAVRLSVIARADKEDEELLTGGRPAAANRAAGADDGFRRRRITATVIPRNLL